MVKSLTKNKSENTVSTELQVRATCVSFSELLLGKGALKDWVHEDKGGT